MKLRAATIAVAAAGILLAATACSSGGGSGTGSAASPAATKTAAAKTYTASDLPTILKTAEKKVGISGTILDNAQVEAKLKQTQTAGGISTLLSQPGVTLSPAACSTLIKQNLNQTPASGTVNSLLTYGQNAVTVTAIAGKKLPSSVSTQPAEHLKKLLPTCSSMKVSVTESGQTISIPFTIKKVDVTTDADTTVALEESLTVPSASGGAGTPVTVQVISAIAGNLAITAEAASGATTAAASSPASATPSPAKVIDAVVAAAK